MKRYVWLQVAAFSFCTLSLVAQDTTSTAGTTIIFVQQDTQMLKLIQQQIADMQARTLDMQRQMQRLDSTSRALRAMEQLIESVHVNSSQNSEQISNLLRSRELDAHGKYDLVRQNLVGAVAMIHSLNGKVNILKSHISATSLDNFVTELNSPQSNKLGFTLDKTIIELINTHIQPQLVKKNFGPLLLQTVQDISKSPLLASIPGLTPALSISNTVITLLRSTSLVKDEVVDPTKIKAFEAALNKYVQYYMALNEATQQFNYGIQRHQDALGLMQQKLYEHSLFFAKALGYTAPMRGPDEKLGEYLNRLLLGFNQDYAATFFVNLERLNTINGSRIDYERLLATNSSLKEANNRVEELATLVNQFEFEFNEFLNSMELYGSRVAASLDIAGENRIAAQSIIDRNKTEFKRLQSQALTDIRASINIKELIERKQNLPYTMRVL